MNNGNILFKLYPTLVEKTTLIKLDNFIKDRTIEYKSINSSTILQILLNNLKHSNTCYIIYKYFITKYKEELEKLRELYNKVKDNYIFFKEKSEYDEGATRKWYGEEEKTDWNNLLKENKKLNRISVNIEMKIKKLNKEIETYKEEWIDIFSDHIYINKFNKKLIDIIVEYNIIIIYNIELQDINKAMFKIINSKKIKCDNKIEYKEYIYFKGNFSGTNLKILYMICNNFSMFIREQFVSDDTSINDVIKYISILREIPST